MSKYFIKILHEEPFSEMSLLNIKGGDSCTCNSGSTFTCGCNGTAFTCTCNKSSSYACTQNLQTGEKN